MNAMERYAAEAECRALVLQAADAVDRSDAPAFAALFVADGTLVRPDGSLLQGRAAIAAAYAARDPDRLTQHLVSNQLVTLQPDGAAALVRSKVLLWSGRHSAPLTPQGGLPMRSVKWASLWMRWSSVLKGGASAGGRRTSSCSGVKFDAIDLIAARAYSTGANHLFVSQMVGVMCQGQALCQLQGQEWVNSKNPTHSQAPHDAPAVLRTQTHICRPSHPAGA